MIGIYGGTFNPVHYGHLRTALDVQQTLALEQVRLIPCAQPTHRHLPDVNAAMRLKMLKLGVAQQARLVVDARELNRDSPSYMVDTLQSIRAEIGGQSLILIIGADAFKHLSTWYQWQHIFDFAHVLVISRLGSKHQIVSEAQFFNSRLTHDQQDLRTTVHGHLYFQEVTRLEISATWIRQMLATGLSPRFLLPDAVIEFINVNQLYVPDTISR